MTPYPKRLNLERVYNASAVGVIILSLLLFTPKVQLDVLKIIEKLAHARPFNQKNLTFVGFVGLLLDTICQFVACSSPLLMHALQIVVVLRALRTGIAYISNVAVREADRKKGIAKMLVAKAEARARSWGCRSIALHCNASNAAAMRLYKGRGFKSIVVPEQAKWPEPKTAPGSLCVLYRRWVLWC